MKFPQATLDKDKYLDKIFDLLNDDDCLIFLDTNIYALFYKINPSARSEFFGWIETLIKKNRVKTPVWALNEYTNRFIRKKTGDYFSALKKVNTTQKEFLEINKFLKMNTDDASLKGTAYKDKDSYFEDLDIISKKIEKIKVLAKAKDENYILSIHDEIQSIFEATVIDSDIFKILDHASVQGENRFKSKLPPGYEDGAKEFNALGDLIIWTEIINYCEQYYKTKALILTNDNKKDWLYAPYKITENSIDKSNSEPEFKIADTRLVFEFELKTKSEELYIFNFELLTQLLIKKGVGDFLNLANALQIASMQEDSDEKVIIENDKIENVQEDVEKTTDAQEPILEKNISKETYSLNALADIDFPLNDNSQLTNIIEQLKSYDWYRQNNAVEKFFSIPQTTFIENSDTKNKLFVIGRNIYQSACGGAFSSVEFIRVIRSRIQKLSDFVLINLINGMLFEIYFNSHGKFREGSFKTAFFEELLDLQESTRLAESFTFINNALIPFKNYFLILPDKIVKKIKIVVNYKEIDFNEFISKANQIESITYEGRDLLIDTANESLGFPVIDGDKESIVEKIKKAFVIPSKQIELEFIPEIKNVNYFIVPRNKKIEKKNWLTESKKD